MKYEDLFPISREEYHRVFQTSSPNAAAEALLRLAFNDTAPGWVERECFAALDDPRIEVRLAAVTGLGHIARRQRRLTPTTVGRLSELKADPELRGRIDDVLDDLAAFGGSSNAHHTD